MTTLQVKRELVANGVSIAGSESVEASADSGFSETVADGQTDKEIVVSIDVTAVKAFTILSTRDVTLETNSGSTPADTINLLAGKPYVFVENDYNAFLLGTDVTSIFITNASGAAAQIDCRFGYDATP